VRSPSRCPGFLHRKDFGRRHRRRARGRSAALDALARAYWKPLYTYARLGRRLSEEAAEDVVQDLFASLVEKGWLARWDPSRARLRTYLRVLLDGLAANTARAAGREKRGGGVRTLSIDAAETEAEIARLAPRSASPEEIYEREWRRWLFTRAVARLEEDYARTGRGARFALFSAADLADDPRPSLRSARRSLLPQGHRRHEPPLGRAPRLPPCRTRAPRAGDAPRRCFER
jgi:RNA polymerase sigma factor (sigma-70 family)